MEKIVKTILEENEAARDDDCVLMYLVCLKKNPKILNKPLGEILNEHVLLGLPNWETVSRCRRKLQEKNEYLQSESRKAKNRELIRSYKEYSRVNNNKE